MPFRHSQVAATLLAVALLPDLTPTQDRVPPYPVTEPVAYREAIAAGTRSESGAPGPRYWTDHVDYRIDATLEPATARITGQIEATYHNRSPAPQRTIWMHLRQNLHAEGAIRNRSVAITGGMEIADVRVDGETVRFRPRGTQLPLRLPEPLAPGESTTISLRFAFTCPPAGSAPRMGHEDHHVFYLGYWYPQFAVHDDVDGWVCESYRGNGEFYMPYGNYDLTFRAPEQWLVRATGTLANPAEVLTDTAVERLAAAMATEEIVHVVDQDDLAAGRVTRNAEQDGLLAWRFQAEDVRDCAVSISDRYIWDATHADVRNLDGSERDEPVLIQAVYETDSSTWPAAAAAARFAIEWMSEHVYPYPWPHMTACEGIIGGGMEYPMMTVVGDSRSVRGVQGTICHELIHMWFPMLVGSNEKRHAWMDEGTTSFFTDLATAALRDSANDRGSMLGYIRSATRMQESPLMTHADFYPRGYGFASYTKPAALLHQLRALLKDGSRDVLMEALQTYAREWAFKHPAPYDLFRTIERVAGQDLDWYWQSGYFEVRHLDHALGTVTDDGQQLSVEIIDRGDLPFPCVVEASYGEGRTQRVTVPVEHWLGGARTATVELPSGAESVRIDPDGDALDVARDNQTWNREG